MPFKLASKLKCVCAAKWGFLKWNRWTGVFDRCHAAVALYEAAENMSICVLAVKAIHTCMHKYVLYNLPKYKHKVLCILWKRRFFSNPNLPGSSNDFHGYLHLLRQVNWAFDSLRTRRSQALGTKTHLLFFFMLPRGRKKYTDTRTHNYGLAGSVLVCAPLSAAGRGGERFQERQKLNDSFLCSGKRGWQKRGCNLPHIWWYSGFLWTGAIQELFTHTHTTWIHLWICNGT